MPDITMCRGTGCPLKENCYRFTAKPWKSRQSYFVEVPYDGIDCEYQYLNTFEFKGNYTKKPVKARKAKK